MLAHPLRGILTLNLRMIAFFIIEGFFKIGLAMKLKPAYGWRWPLVNGIMALILDGLI